jgi:hypothetical protein
MTMHARGRNKLRQGVEELEGGEQHLGAAVDVGFREAVVELSRFGGRVNS